MLLHLAPLSLLACSEKYYCGPGTHAEGEWCLVDADGPAPADTSTDTAGDTSGDTSGDTAADTARDTGEDTGQPRGPARVVINELMASNSESVTDELGEYDDWVELYNAGDRPMPLEGLSLSDLRDQPAQYRFPAGAVLAPGAWLVVWCDGQPEQGDYHAAFTLQSAADELYLIEDPEGANGVLDAVTFTDFPKEQSAIRVPDGSDTWAYTSTVTPGAENPE